MDQSHLTKPGKVKCYTIFEIRRNFRRGEAYFTTSFAIEKERERERERDKYKVRERTVRKSHTHFPTDFPNVFYNLIHDRCCCSFGCAKVIPIFHLLSRFALTKVRRISTTSNKRKTKGGANSFRSLTIRSWRWLNY